MPASSIPFPPMEAELVRELPDGDGWQYEPKWDGFRGVLENAGGELALWSRNERPLLRYFPELRPLGELLPPQSALDGEIVIARDGALDFDAMQTRLHPAESRDPEAVGRDPRRVRRLRRALWDGEPVWKLPLAERRARVEALTASASRLPRATLADARAWLDRFEALGLDGVIGKRLDAAYLPGSRDAVVKVKEHRTADCFVLGVRWKGDRSAIATLLLGLYRDDGERRLRRLVRRRRADARRGGATRPAARRRVLRGSRLRAEPLGHAASCKRAGCGRSSSSRCGTTRCRATASGTARSSSAGATTRIRPIARGARSGRRATRTPPASKRSSAETHEPRSRVCFGGSSPSCSKRERSDGGLRHMPAHRVADRRDPRRASSRS